MKRVCFRFVFVFLGLLLGFLLAEVTCKFLDLHAARQYRRVSERISRPSRIPDVRFELIPGASGVTPDQTEAIRVNRFGFRGPEIEKAKPSGVYRIAVLGDSIAFGRTLKEAAVFPYQLPVLLKEQFPERSFEIINASLSGRDTWEEVALLEHRVLELAPDLVIIQVCLNDHIRFPPPDPRRTRGAFGERAWYTYSSLLDLLGRQFPAFRKWHVATATRLGFDMRSPPKVLEEYALDIQYIHDTETNWPLWHREFLRANELCRARGVDFMIAVFPTARLLGEKQPQTIPALTELAHEHNIPLVDLIHAYQKSGTSLLQDYTHPTAAGQRLAAEVIAEAIAQDFLALETPSGEGE